MSRISPEAGLPPKGDGGLQKDHDNKQAEFGMVRDGGGWRLLSLGLVLFDVPQLAKQWAAADLAAHEDAAIADLLHLEPIHLPDPIIAASATSQPPTRGYCSRLAQWEV